MASSPTSLEDLVTCSVCLENFTDPRALPCLHSYCKGCLERLMTPQGKITCPQCRMEFEVPQKDVSNFSSNFMVVNLLDLTSLTQEVSLPDSHATTSTQCLVHAGRDCELYCEDCSKFVCYQCISKWGRCHQHSYRDAKELLGQFRQILKDFTRKVEQKLPTIQQHLGLLEDIRAKQTANFAETQEKIEETFAQHAVMLNIRKDELVQVAFATHQKNQEGLNCEFERVQIEQAKMVNTNELCRNILAIENPDVFIPKYCEVKDKIFEIDLPELVSEIDVHEIRFKGNESLLRDVLLNYGNIVSMDPNEPVEGSEAIEKDEKLADLQYNRGNSRNNGRASSGTIPGTSGSSNSSPAREEGVGISPNRSKRDDSNASSTRNGLTRTTTRATRSVSTTAGPAAVDNSPVYWKLYPKNFTDRCITIEDKGLGVRTQNLKFVSVVGVPGFKTGQHTWKVKFQNLGNGVGVGICLGKEKPGLCIMLDSTLHRLTMSVVITVELDCEAKIVKVVPDGHLASSIQYHDDKKNIEVHPYFVLFPSTMNGVLKVVEMDGKSVDDGGSCRIL